MAYGLTNVRVLIISPDLLWEIWLLQLLSRNRHLLALALVFLFFLPVLVLGEVITSHNSDISVLVIERLKDRDVEFALSLPASLSCDTIEQLTDVRITDLFSSFFLTFSIGHGGWL